MNNTQQKENKGLDKKSLVFKTQQEEHFTIKNTLQRLKVAIQTAESIDYPNRWDLLEIYFDIVKDAHLNSVVKHRKTRVKGLEYALIKTNGKVDTKATQLFDQFWFTQFLEYALDAMFYGNSLIEMSKNKGKLMATLIPRQNVIPEFQEIKVHPTSLTGDIDYSAPIYAKKLVDVNNNNDNRNLGEFLSVSKLVLFKNEVMLNWSQHIEIFGQPLRVATTTSQDQVEINQILHFMKEIGRSGYMVKNDQTEIEFIESSANSSSSAMYKDFEIFVNEEISKKILGGTMITDSGSSRSQSEVHERGSFLYTKADISFIEGVINNQLLPVLRNLGLVNAKGLEFQFQEPEILTMAEKIEIDRFLMDNFTVKEIDYFEKRYGVGLEFLSPEERVDEGEAILKEEMTFAKTSDRYDVNLKLTEE